MVPKNILCGGVPPQYVSAADMPNAKFWSLEAAGCVWAGLDMYQEACCHLAMCFKIEKR